MKEGDLKMDCGFVHIGMIKTATTYMQNLWFRSQKYSLSWKGNIEFVKSLRKAIKNNTFDRDFEVNIETDKEYKEGQKLIISNESFSTAYLNEIEYQSEIPVFIDKASSLLGSLPSTNSKLLLVVREPISWIRSSYIQAIKQGWSGSAQDFVDKQILFLLHSLNLKYIISCYKRYFSDILILPFELLKDDENKLWRTISEKFDVPVVTGRINKLNVSLDLKKVYILSKMNEMGRTTIKVLSHSSSYNNRYEKKYILNNYKQSRKWVHRRFVEYASNKEIKDMYKLFNLDEAQEDFLKFDLPKNLIKNIEDNYLDFLEGKIKDKFLGLYNKKFIKYII